MDPVFGPYMAIEECLMDVIINYYQLSGVKHQKVILLHFSWPKA